MAGEAVTNAFLLATATVMIGPQADLFGLNPATHSIGLVKNFMIDATPAYVDLSQGVKNTLVYSVLNKNDVKATMEVFEYTSKNLAYGLGLDGSAITTISTTSVTNALVTGDGTTTDVFVATGDLSAVLVTGDWMIVQEVGGTDAVHVSKVVTSVYSSPNTTITVRDPVPTGMVLGAGSLISTTNRMDVGSKVDQPFLSAKIVGIMPQGNEAVVILIPKLRITKGFTLAFHSDAFQNLPYEFTPYELVASDPNYADFANTGVAAVFDRQ
jgi:hypothetical protein